MTAVQEPAALDADKLMSFVFNAVSEVGATLNTALVVMGDKLGLYRALAGAGPLTATGLAQRTGTSERYVAEWLNAQAAGGFVEYDPNSGRYVLPPEQAIALTDESSPAYLPGFFQIALGSVLDSPRITEAATTGEGIGWHDHVSDVHEGCERFFRPGYNAHLVSEWLPALSGVVERLERGASPADVGCGHGASTILMAQSFPASRFVGSDYHEGSIDKARQRAVVAGVQDRVQFETAPASALRVSTTTSSRCLTASTTWATPSDGAARERGASARRHLDDRRACRRRPSGGQPQSRRPRVLRLLNAFVHAMFAIPRSRPGAGRASRGGEDPRGGDCGWLYTVPPRGRDSLQHRVRSSPLEP